jgi:lysine-N-methylase
MTIYQHPLLAQFSCLGDRCEDTCCKGWSMQLDDATYETYQTKAPELLDAVEAAEESPWIMRKDKRTTYCVKFENGLCGIHKKYGDSFLGDACHFYPRATRTLGDQTLMTATLSCPEVARLALFDTKPFAWHEAKVDRLPHGLKDYLPEKLSGEQSRVVHEAFLKACEDEGSAEQILARIASVARSMAMLDQASWPQAIPFYLRMADGRLPVPQTNINDPFNLLHALMGLIVATQKPMSDRLRQTVSDMERMLAVTLDWQTTQMQTSEQSAASYQQARTMWDLHSPHYQPLLKRYLQMQLSVSLFPFSGLGGAPAERMTIIGVRLATLRLALMAAHQAHGDLLPQDTIVRVVQSLSRFLDHLGDAAYSLAIYKETGWDQEARLRGLLF